MKDIESYSNEDLEKELEGRGYRMCDLDLDLVDRSLLDDIIDSFLAENLEGRQKMRDLVIKLK